MSNYNRWSNCPKCGENVCLEGENVRTEVLYYGTCPKCGSVVQEKDSGKGKR
ncbi:hypothetical protein UT300016_26850 [Clostridium senegalense]